MRFFLSVKQIWRIETLELSRCLFLKTSFQNSLNKNLNNEYKFLKESKK